jgi:hypothetical protein
MALTEASIMYHMKAWYITLIFELLKPVLVTLFPLVLYPELASIMNIAADSAEMTVAALTVPLAHIFILSLLCGMST